MVLFYCFYHRRLRRTILTSPDREHDDFRLNDLTELLDKKNQQQKDLLDQLKKSKQELLATNKIVIGLKEQLVKMAAGTQTEVPSVDGKPARTKVDFHHNFGFVTADGWTLTNPPESWLRLNPGKPLTLNVSLAQAQDKTWHSYVTSDSNDITVDVKVAAVNPYIFKPHWYEGIGVNIGLGGGTNQSGAGALVAVGLNYKIKQFTVGPNVWFGINNVVDKYYGLTFEWRPFEKVDR